MEHQRIKKIEYVNQSQLNMEATEFQKDYVKKIKSYKMKSLILSTVNTDAKNTCVQDKDAGMPERP